MEDSLRKEIEEIVNEFIVKDKFEEYHELYSNKVEWNKEKEQVARWADLVLIRIEEDDYKGAITLINKIIMKLGSWKSSLSKTL